MAVFPNVEEVMPVLENFEVGADEDGVVVSEVEMEFETARRRPLGSAAALIADIPWVYLPLFRRFAYRNDSVLLTFRVDGALGKPTPAAAELASQRWIADVLDEDTAHEYASAVEAPQEEVEPELLEATPGQGGPLGVAGPEVAALRARLVQLETLLANRDPPAGPVGQPSRLGAMVFGNQPQPGLSPQDVEALKRAVGPPPGRIGRNEAAQRGPGRTSADHVHFAEHDREVAEAEAEQDLVAALESQLPSNPDPFQKMLILQLKQTSDLVKALAPRASADPLQAVLGGSDSGSAGSGGGSGGVKGYAARELFLKQIEDDNLVLSLMRKHARQELGISEAKEEGSLMRTYLEQRIPIGDHRTMAQLGFMMAWGWEAASTFNNQQCSDAGLLWEDAQLCGASMSGFRPHRPGLVADRTSRAKLPRYGGGSKKVVSDPLFQVASSDMGGSKCELPQGHRHVRDEVEDPGCAKQNFFGRRQGWRHGDPSAEMDQEEKGRKRWRHCPRRPSTCMTESCSREFPEQRSESRQSLCGKIVDEEPSFKPVEDFPKNSFSSCLYNIQLDRPIDAFGLIDECIRHLERIPCSFNTFKSRSLRPSWLSRS